MYAKIENWANNLKYDFEVLNLTSLLMGELLIIKQNSKLIEYYNISQSIFCCLF